MITKMSEFEVSITLEDVAERVRECLKTVLKEEEFFYPTISDLVMRLDLPHELVTEALELLQETDGVSFDV